MSKEQCTREGAGYQGAARDIRRRRGVKQRETTEAVLARLARARVRHDEVFTAAVVIARLEEAGRSLLALPHLGHATHMRTGGMDFVREAIEGYGWTGETVRPAAPSPRQISEMDQALAWIPLIPVARTVLRRIVGARALVSPVTDRHLYSWRRIGRLVRADHKAVQRWHAQGIDEIVRLLTK